MPDPEPAQPPEAFVCLDISLQNAKLGRRAVWHPVYVIARIRVIKMNVAER